MHLYYNSHTHFRIYFSSVTPVVTPCLQGMASHCLCCFCFHSFSTKVYCVPVCFCGSVCVVWVCVCWYASRLFATNCSPRALPPLKYHRQEFCQRLGECAPKKKFG